MAYLIVIWWLKISLTCSVLWVVRGYICYRLRERRAKAATSALENWIVSRDLLSFERRAKRGFMAGFTNDHVGPIDIRTRRRVRS